MRFCLFSILFTFPFFSSFICKAQEKLEKEFVIKQTEVPKPALDFINSLGLKHKLKWYREEFSGGFSFECKTKYKKKCISIEFDSTGILEDLEIDLPQKNLPTRIALNLKKQCDSLFDNWKFLKIQEQYRDSVKVMQYFEGKIDANTLYYEIVLKARINGIYRRHEITTNQNGDIIKHLLIATKNEDNLEY